MWGRALTVGALGLTAACDARVIDLRSDEARALANADVGVFRRDAGFVDAGAGIDAGFNDAGIETAALLREGTWTGRSDYQAVGQVSLERAEDGRLELRFSDDFIVSRVPGPVVVLSYRDSIGRGIDPAAGDVDLGRLERSSGAQTYAVPPGADDRDFAWVYCEPFALEVARAALEVR